MDLFGDAIAGALLVTDLSGSAKEFRILERINKFYPQYRVEGINFWYNFVDFCFLGVSDYWRNEHRPHYVEFNSEREAVVYLKNTILHTESGDIIHQYP